MTLTCLYCGGAIEGDGYSVPLHCEMIETPETEPDSDITYCNESTHH